MSILRRLSEISPILVGILLVCVVSEEVDKSDLINLSGRVIYGVEGHSVNILAKAGEGRTIQFCRWDAVNNSRVGSSGLIFINEVDELPAFSALAIQDSDDGSTNVPGYEPFGGGLSRGECGITIQNITEEDLTTWKYLLIEFSKTEGNPVAVTRDVVLKKAVRPTSPQLQGKIKYENILETLESIENGLTISCCTENGLPSPNLEIVFDDVPLLSSIQTLQDQPNQYCIETQRKFTRLDTRKKLQCLSEHLTFSGYQEDSINVGVSFGPEILSQFTNPTNRTVQQLVSPQQNIVALRFTANPQPTVDWHLTNFETLPSTVSVTTTSTSDPYTWDSTLVFDPEVLSSSESPFVFKVVATNEVGSTEMYVIARREIFVTVIEVNDPIPAGSNRFFWKIIILIVLLLISSLIILFILLARKYGWLCFTKREGRYDPRDSTGKVYNPVMTTTTENEEA